MTCSIFEDRQLPPVQCWPPLQTTPQPPQLASSAPVGMQEPPHQDWPLGQEAASGAGGSPASPPASAGGAASDGFWAGAGELPQATSARRRAARAGRNIFEVM